MAAAKPRSDLELVAGVLAGEDGAATAFLDSISPALWASVVRLEGDGPGGEAAFLDVLARLKQSDYAALRAFDARAQLKTFIVLFARDVLSERVARSFVETPSKTWPRFARFFDPDIKRRIARRFPRDATTALRDDVYQEVCLKLVENDCRRIRAYSGKGSFIGYVLLVVDRILIDLVRRDAPRRRLPAAVARLSPLGQATFAAIAWEGCPKDPARLAMALRGRLDHDPGIEEIRLALDQTVAAARLEPLQHASRPDTVSLDGLLADAHEFSIADGGATPEERLLEDEEDEHRNCLIEAIRRAAASLPPAERLYLQIVFSTAGPLPARDIARMMGCPVENVYRLKQQMKRWIADVTRDIAERPDVSVCAKSA